MSDSKVAAILAVKANSRVVLATSLVASNTELEALRAEISVLRAKPVAAPAPRVIRRDFDAERKARMARNRDMTAAYFAAFPGERSCTPYQLEQFAAMSAH
jgi:hypothetical protein